MKAIVLCARSPSHPPSLRRGFLLIPLSLACFGLAPMAQAVGPDTDGAITGSNNGEEILTATPIDGSGIASRYAGDRNIASDPAVIFADDFDSYTTVDQARIRWGLGSGLTRMRIATEPDKVVSGKSIEMSLPITTSETGISLSRILNPAQDVVYMRMYQKFDPGFDASGSGHNGIRLSAQYPETAGRRPPPDGTGFFLFHLENNIIGSHAGESDPGFTHLYSYWPRQRTNFGDHWYPDGTVIPFSPSIGNMGEWLAFPAQYPDFRVIPNFQPLRDQWYCVELMVRANTPGQNNGEVAYWIDGQLKGSWPNLFLRSINTLKIDRALLGLHASSSERINKKWYDNVVIATQYIGPIVSATTARGDFNRDGKPDYLLYNAGTRRTAVWYLNNNVYIGGAFAPTLPVGWRVIDAADFNRDGKPDYALFNASTRQTAIWYLSGVMFIGSAAGPTLPSGWALVATGDFNNDGKPDYVIYNSSTRQTAIWYLNNNVYIGGASGPSIPSSWSLVGIADFNRDGKPDYLLFNPGTHNSVIWYLSGTTRIGSVFGPTIAAGFNLMGAADFNRDGKPDYLLFNPSTRQTAIWYLNNNVRIGTAVGPTLAAGFTLAAP
jgi:hypothetical protein